MGKKKEIRNILEKELLTKYPKKALRGYQVPSHVNLEPILKALKESSFLRTCDNLNIKWLVKNYDKVCSGMYKDYKKSANEGLFTHTYTDEDYEKLFDNLSNNFSNDTS